MTAQLRPSQASSPRVGASADGDDLLASTELHRRLPGLREALDGGAMAERARLIPLGRDGAAWTPGKVAYQGADGAVVRYTVRGHDGADRLLLGRMLTSDAGFLAYRDRVRRCAASGASPRADSRAVGDFPELRLVVNAFPLDPELPSLPVAVDPTRVLPVLRHVRPGAERVSVAVAHYPRTGRCVLRYDLDGGARLYGKVRREPGRSEQTVLADLRRAGVPVPRPLGADPVLRMDLLDELPGRAMLRAPVDLHRSVAQVARLADAVHLSAAPMPRVRRIEDEVAAARREIQVVAPVWPEVAAHADQLLVGCLRRAAGTRVSPLVPSHGDFTPAQILVDEHAGGRWGVLDFDEACLAEPAFDLGRFEAYLRLALARRGLDDAPVAAFLSAYRPVPSRMLFDRVAVYRTLALVRLALHACLQLKPGRLATALAVLAGVRND